MANANDKVNQKAAAAAGATRAAATGAAGAAADADFVKEITPKNVDYSQWYVDVVRKAELADYAPVKGCMVIRPAGYALWENYQAGMDRRFKATGVQNAYFPLLIPESFFKKEAEHVEGFAPEVAWVTHGGGEELTEKLAIRPTSETIICSMYAKWIKSYRDLPVLINQWCSVLRWEKATRPFIRTTEFLWQEGHTAHRTPEEAEERTQMMLEIYRDFVESDLAIPVIPGRKSPQEKFAGAVHTYSIEALMSDGRALQSATSHNLGDHFAKVFDIQYLDSDGSLKYVHQTSWGATTRLIGAMIMVHGDDRGLVIPPKVAPTQAVIVPIMSKDRETVLSKARELRRRLAEAGFLVHLDDRDEYTPGWKFNEWEMRGIPVRIELGPRDVKSEQVVLVRRDNGKKEFAGMAGLEDTLRATLDDIQSSLYLKAKRFMEEHTKTVRTLDEIKATVEGERGFMVTGWCGDDECEDKIQETGATIRNIPFGQPAPGDVPACACCGKPGKYLIYCARAY